MTQSTGHSAHENPHAPGRGHRAGGVGRVNEIRVSRWYTRAAAEDPAAPLCYSRDHADRV